MMLHSDNSLSFIAKNSCNCKKYTYIYALKKVRMATLYITIKL